MRVAAQVGWELKAMLRNGEQLLVSFGLPLLALVALFTVPLEGLPGRSDAVAGVVAMAVLSSSFTSQAIALAFDRRWGVLRMLSTTPLGSGGLLAGKAGAVGAILVVQFAAILGVAVACGWRPGSLAGLGFAAVFLLLGGAVFVALAVLLGGTLRAQGVIALANLAWVVMTFAMGALLPLGPGSWLRWLPPGALGEAMRAALAGSFDGVGALVLLAWAAAIGVVAARAMRWD